jgi:hypothetical protein
MNVGKQDGTCATAVRGRKWRSLAFFGFFLSIQSKIKVFHSMLLIVVTNKRIISEPTDMLACQEIYCVKLRKHTLVLEILANILLTWNPPRQLCIGILFWHQMQGVKLKCSSCLVGCSKVFADFMRREMIFISLCTMSRRLLNTCLQLQRVTSKEPGLLFAVSKSSRH